MCKKWLHINKEIAYKKTIRCDKITQLKNSCTRLGKAKSKRENEVTKPVQGLDEIEKELCVCERVRACVCRSMETERP